MQPVLSEPVWAPNSLLTGNLQGKTVIFRHISRNGPEKLRVYRGLSRDSLSNVTGKLFDNIREGLASNRETKICFERLERTAASMFLRMRPERTTPRSAIISSTSRNLNGMRK